MQQEQQSDCLARHAFGSIIHQIDRIRIPSNKNNTPVRMAAAVAGAFSNYYFTIMINNSGSISGNKNNHTRACGARKYSNKIKCALQIGSLSVLKAAAMAAADETTAMNGSWSGDGGTIDSYGLWLVAAASIKWRRRVLYPHRRNVLFLLRRNKIFFERSKNNIDLH